MSRPETLAVGSVNNRGKSSFYSENCTAILVVVPSGVDIMDGQNKSKVVSFLFFFKLCFIFKLCLFIEDYIIFYKISNLFSVYFKFNFKEYI